MGFIIATSGGCTYTNLLHGDDYFWRHDATDLVICSIDTDIEDERNGKKPSGYLSQPLSPELWQDNWRHRIDYIGVQAKPLPETYRGPSNYQLAMYSLKSRREFGLPDVVPGGPSSEFIKRAYQTIDAEPRTACQWLNWRSPTCLVGPAGYSQPYEFSRGCKGDT